MHHAKRIHGSREIFEKPLRKTPRIISAWLTIFDQISPAPVLLLEQERLYESYGISSWGRSTFPGAEPPAGPPKSSKPLGEITFPEKSSIFVVRLQLRLSKIGALNEMSWTSRMNHRTRLDLK